MSFKNHCVRQKQHLTSHTDFTQNCYAIPLLFIQITKVINLFGKPLLHFPLILPVVAILFKRGQVWHFYTDVTNINISWDLWKIHILYS